VVFLLGMVGIGVGCFVAWMLNEQRIRSEKLDFVDELGLITGCSFYGGLFGTILGAIITIWKDNRNEPYESPRR